MTTAEPDDDQLGLTFDRRGRKASRPQLHALLVGVSAYQFLPDLDSKQPGPLGLRQLAGPALAAWKLERWLKMRNRQGELHAELATIRLLASPHPLEHKNAADLPSDLVCPTLDNYDRAAKAWQVDCARSDRDWSLYYFGGHGIQLSNNDHLQLLDDFGSARPLLNHTVAVKNIFNGMKRKSDSDSIAKTQLFFVDACKVDERELDEHVDVERQPTQVLEELRGENPPERTPILVPAAADGATAGAIRGKGTIFGEALLHCLDRAAELRRGRKGQPQWDVTMGLLLEALNTRVRELAKDYEEKQRLGQGIYDGSRLVLCTLDSAPTVEVRVEVQPPGAAVAASARLEHKALSEQHQIADFLENPATREVSIGSYDVRVEFPEASEFETHSRWENATVSQRCWSLECE